MTTAVGTLLRGTVPQHRPHPPRRTRRTHQLHQRPRHLRTATRSKNYPAEHRGHPRRTRHRTPHTARTTTPTGHDLHQPRRTPNDQTLGP
ncbi:hypothetical protein HBB16_17280 [Pseudonocardia sp. MCCB 268]|nr:hypothetical protein [Pseudonocardia cytotoxica]